MADSQEQLGNYLLIEKIAQGGMAQVFKARTADPQGIDRLVVIKRILPHISSDPEYVHMLIDEAKIAVHFTHGNIAQVYDLGKAGDDYFIAMEYVDGKTLGQILREFKERRKPLPIDQIVYWISELCYGLDYMHRKTDAEGHALKVVHRDVSPQNIIVSYSGNVKIIDFGVAKALDKLSQTQSGVLKGKFAYMSPEQAEGDDLDCRSDIFSAGTILWELLTLDRLFKRANNKETLKAVRAADVPHPSKLRPDIPKELEKIVEKALRRKRDNRYSNASDMADDLNRFLAKYYPNFKRTDVATFLYKYFGPEPDEEGLEPEMPQVEVPREPKPDEPLPELKEEVTHVSRIAKVGRFKGLFKSFQREPLARALKGKLFLLIGLFSLLAAGAVGVGFYGFYKLSARGILYLTIQPNGAQISVLGRTQTILESDHEIILPANKEVIIKVALKGYVPQEVPIQLARKEVKKLTVMLEKEVPPFGDLVVTSQPSGAIIYLDNVDLAKQTPAKLNQLKNGKKYKVGLFLKGYEFVENEIEIRGGEQVQMDVTLIPEPAELILETEPNGAEVLVGNEIKGVTPLTLAGIKPGDTLEVTLKLSGYQDGHQTLVLEPGEKKKLIFEMKVLENPN